MAAVKMDMEQARFNMIEQQIRPWEVLDPEVLGFLRGQA
jgi:protein-L-isoaspartate(D-aspartate) O-methyltransferase